MVEDKPKKKKKKTPIYDKREITVEEERKIKRGDKIIIQIKGSLEQLQARIEADLNIINTTKKPIHKLRAIDAALNGEPTNIFCKDLQAWRSILVCGFACSKQCNNFLSKRYICKMLRCDNTEIHKCDIAGVRCDAFRAFELFPDKYIKAYAPIHELRSNTTDKKFGFPKPKKKRRRRKKL